MEEKVLYDQNDKSKNGKGSANPLLIFLILLLLAITGYLGYDKYFGKQESNEDDKAENLTTESFSLSFDKLDQIEDKIGSMFYWIEEEKLDDMNNLNNDIKICISYKNAMYDGEVADYGTHSYSNAAIEVGLSKVFQSSVTMKHNDFEDAYYGWFADCFFPYEYDKEKGIYNIFPTGLEGPGATVEKKITKVEKNNDNYVVYIKAIYRDDNGNVYIGNDVTGTPIVKFNINEETGFEFLETSTENKTLSEYIPQGYTYKLTFEEKDSNLFWTKYEMIK